MCIDTLGRYDRETRRREVELESEADNRRLTTWIESGAPCDSFSDLVQRLSDSGIPLDQLERHAEPSQKGAGWPRLVDELDVRWLQSALHDVIDSAIVDKRQNEAVRHLVNSIVNDFADLPEAPKVEAVSTPGVDL